MAENGNQNQNGAEEAKTFTQDEVNKMITDRLGREKAKYADYEATKAELAKYKAAEDSGKSEIEKLRESNQALLDKLAGAEKKAAIDKARSKVSTDTGVPVDLLTGEDEETCKTQAEAILKFAKGKEYPGVNGNKHESRDSGSTDPTANDYKKLANQIFGRKD